MVKSVIDSAVTANRSAALATDTVVVPATYSCVSTPALVATADTPVAELATDVGESVNGSVVVSITDFVASTVGFVASTVGFVASITDLAVTTSSFVGTTTDSVGVVVDSVVLSATGSLHIEEIFV